MKRFALVVAALVVVALVALGCKPKQEASAPGSLPPGHPPMSAMQSQAPASADDALSGKVVETMDSGGYTYVCLEKNGKKTWVALPQTAVKVGQQLTCMPGGVMQNFTSKTLKRTFESIVFSPGIL